MATRDDDRGRGRHRRRRRRGPGKPPTEPTERTLTLVEHATLEALPDLTRKRLKWLSEKLDIPEVSAISLAVLQLVEEYEDAPGVAFAD